MKKKTAVLLAMCILLLAGIFIIGCSQGSEPQQASTPAPAPAKEEPKEKAAPAAAEAEEEEDEDKFGC